MRVARIVYRGTFLVLLITAGGLLTLLFQRGTMPRKGLSSKITCWWHRNVLRILGIKLSIYGTPSDAATLFAANHLSWLDIHVVGSQLPARFLSRAEVRHWPVFGWLASRAGTLYIPRGGKDAAAQANTVMHAALLNQHHVVLFPESTTSNGNIRRFHGRLMQSAIDAKSLLQPLAIRYPHTEGSVHDAVLYVGDMSFMQSVKNVMAARGVKAELHFLEPVEAYDKTRDELARYAEAAVKALFNSRHT
jgi:1-acyl-sn-glycerol-3-phosphate acyltransferase